MCHTPSGKAVPVAMNLTVKAVAQMARCGIRQGAFASGWSLVEWPNRRTRPGPLRMSRLAMHPSPPVHDDSEPDVQCPNSSTTFPQRLADLLTPLTSDRDSRAVARRLVDLVHPAEAQLPIAILPWKLPARCPHPQKNNTTRHRHPLPRNDEHLRSYANRGEREPESFHRRSDAYFHITVEFG